MLRGWVVDKRTIVNLQVADLDNAEEIRFWLDSAPMVVPGAEVQRRLTITPAEVIDWTNASAVRQHGQKLGQALCEHPAIKNALDTLLQTPANDVHSLFFNLVSEDAERFHWEALWDPNNAFLALDARWPIARIAKSVAERNLPSIREFMPPLRITAVLSAAGISAVPEWDSLEKVVTEARNSGLEIVLTLLVGEEDLLDKIQAAAPPQTTVETITTQVEMEQALRRSQPHIVHFFCHGSVSHQRRLMLASFQDWLVSDADGSQVVSSVQLPIKDLVGMEALANAWLVTLNCCEGAKAVENAANGTGEAQQRQREELHSMVRELVATGVPAAIGMLEPLDASDAHAFCTGLYQSIFTDLQNLLKNAAAKPDVEINWAQSLRSARLSVLSRHGNDPNQFREWTIPALYVRPERFRLSLATVDQTAEPVVAAAASSSDQRLLMRQVQDVTDILRALPPSTPLSVRQQILALLDDIPQWMRPNELGVFA